MKVVIQNVIDANVKIENEVVGKISHGFLLLVGFTYGDDIETIEKIVNKITKLRVFQDENGKTNLSLKDKGGDILSVSQFTLYASLKDGNRPSFVNALEPIKAKEFYEIFNSKLEEQGFKVEKGVFGADMKVSFTNDGPFTIIVDSKELFNK